MAEMIAMPKLGFDMAEGTLVRWVIAEGQEVKKAPSWRKLRPIKRR
jgi:pyruvate dehydrogenase E2 component (dihydrolipoamide acetyltransferase)